MASSTSPRSSSNSRRTKIKETTKFDRNRNISKNRNVSLQNTRRIHSSKNFELTEIFDYFMARDSPSSPPGGTWEKISPCSRYLHVNVDCSCTENKEKDKGREKLLVGDGKSRRFLHERSIAFITERKEEKHAARGYFCVCNIDSLQTRKWIRRSLRRQRHVT